MKPLAVHGGVAATIWFVCAAAWALFELGLAIRVRGASGRDRSFVPLTLAVVGGMAQHYDGEDPKEPGALGLGGERTTAEVDRRAHPEIAHNDDYAAGT